MDPISLLIGAIAAGAKDVTSETTKDAYRGLKSLIHKHFGPAGDVAISVEQLEKAPESPHRQGVLKEELEKVKIASDLVTQAQTLLDFLNKEGVKSRRTYKARVKEGGASAQGTKAAASATGGLTVSGDAKTRGETHELRISASIAQMGFFDCMEFHHRLRKWLAQAVDL